ncbi:hypothetical protein DDB_G0281799 [Dictyostelium discoideum AX4]|uniref:Probable serine/threonine-protein kinase abkB n=1 Tax=Dictyostelium discoideum TaxID=44689 RepID=ABKB_DICDI|nr:hypothetical protein DDB_G0281799 [Dictyostelium discoideum AX4]Q54TR5.1 RecName: Full=Probable serine/threonine-protein kinase abkB [Dictyostelium discoideum]EAL66661.1 hypothetical protein DDB_G0281799 [Dictyostelium discoideum AX4]|eukprot:XP_640526.1 hypothetical protein DDB_G0281799 [Dictyostelium discoideum AX4]
MNQIHSTILKKGILNIKPQIRNITKCTNTINYNNNNINNRYFTSINKNKNIENLLQQQPQQQPQQQLQQQPILFVQNQNNINYFKREYTNIGGTSPNRQSVPENSTTKTTATATVETDNVVNSSTTFTLPKEVEEEIIDKNERGKEQEQENKQQKEQKDDNKSGSIFSIKGWLTISILSVLALGTKLVIDPPQNIDKLDLAFIRNLRVLYAGFKITFYYKYYLMGLNRGDEGFAENIQIAHKLAAKAMVDLCYQNKGIFIKVAQIIASLDHILPQEYIKSLSIFQDHAPFVTFEEVEKLFKIETGKHPDDMFIDFERLPINSASLAQVHKAKLKLENDEIIEVAVKVQYPGLMNKFQKDMDSLDNVLTYITLFFPSFQFSWILGEASSCLSQELDFVNEAKNSEKMKQLFIGNQQLSIPKVYWNHTTKRILTMEFIHGVRIDNREGLDKLGIDLKELYYLFSDIFAQQIFVHGFLHSDPHPGNLLVRKTPNGKPDLVLLDHGLYKKIDENVRLDFCHLWKSLCLGDAKTSEFYAERLGAGIYAKHLGILLNLNPSKSRENLRNMKRELKDQTLVVINEILKNLPKEILLVLKTNNLIRQITTHFGIENGFLNMAKTCIKGIYTGNDIITKLKYYLTLCIFNIEIKVIDFIKKRKPPQVEIPSTYHHHH